MIENVENEVWKEISGYESLYCVSNKGRVKTLQKYNLRGQLRKEKILKQYINKKGYLYVVLFKDRKCKKFRVHRLVAEAFLPNPNNFPCINHKSEIKTQNNVENLEFCSVAYNNAYGTARERAAKSNSIKQKNDPKKSTPIKCLDLETNKETIYPSISEAARQLNISSSTIWHNIYKTKSPYKNRYIFTEA